MSVFSVLGGDLRSAAVIEKISSLGHQIKLFGLPEDFCKNKTIHLSNNINDTITNSQYIILPLPATHDEVTINMPLTGERITIQELSELINSNQIIFAGKISRLFQATMEMQNLTYFDYSKREEFSVLNAIPTAEGAIEIALHELPVVLHGTPCLVVGYGRIGKILANKLQSLGASVTVSARRAEHLAWIQAYGYHGIETKNLNSHANKFKIIFNTIPDLVITRETLIQVSKDCLIIDLASKPGGVDFALAETLGIKAIQALSLPGKAAPHTAGTIIADTILNIINELEVKI